MSTKSRGLQRWKFGGFLTFLALTLWPIPYVAAPQWKISIVSTENQPLAGISVRLIYQNYSTENNSHEITLITDKSGQVEFPMQHERAFLVERMYYTILSALTGVHASFGRHASVFAFGSNGYEGTALSGKYVTDWRGTPDSMESKIIVKQ